jgi:ssDNA thymidine ADP-ribosyltransferase, DarT
VAKPDPLDSLRLYHFTDTRNLPSIRELGGLYSLAMLEDMGVEIPAAGGNEWSHDADHRNGLDEYVHLCFRHKHPMEWAAKQDGRIKESIFLQIRLEVLKRDGVVYTPDVSNKSGVDICSLDDARKLIDLEVLYSWTDWKDPKIKERLKLAEKCEILVPNHIPIRLIRNMPDG